MNMHMFIAIGIIDEVAVAMQEKIRSPEELVLNMYLVCQSFMTIPDEHFSVSLKSTCYHLPKWKDGAGVGGGTDGEESN